MNAEQLNLNKWDEKSKQLALMIKGNQYKLIKKTNKTLIINGWYAEYSEGTFVFFKNRNGELALGWRNNFELLDNVKSIDWDMSAKRRHLICYNLEGNCILEAKYRTLRRFLNPIKLFSELFVPDDDWGLNSDLPSHVHSSFNNGNISKNFKTLLDRENNILRS